MELKTIKFYEEQLSEEQLSKSSALFFELHQHQFTVKEAKNGTVFGIRDDVRITCKGGDIRVRLDDLTAAIQQYVQAGDKIEIVRMQYDNHTRPVVVSFTNHTQGVSLINVKLQQIAERIRKDTDKNEALYKNMLAKIQHQEYLLLYMEIASGATSDYELNDMTLANTLDKSCDGIRTLFTRNRDTQATMPQRLNLGMNELDNLFAVYALQYDAVKDGFSDGENFYYNLRDIVISMNISVNLPIMIENM